jgi:hypothetical protein
MTGADGGADPGARPRWRWDAALSFAGAGHARCRIGARCGSGPDLAADTDDQALVHSAT